MANYLIKKVKTIGEIILLDFETDGYKFKPNVQRKEILEINEVTIIKQAMIEHVVAIKFNRTFKKLVSSIFLLLESDDTSDDETVIALDEIARMKNILEYRYHKFLSLKKEKEFLAKLTYLEKELKYKQLLIRERMLYIDNDAKAHSK